MTQPRGMNREQIEEFLAEPRNVTVAAIRKDGRPQMTPNWFYWDGSRFYIATTKTRRKYPNFKRDPRVQLAIDDPTSFKTVLIDGTVEIREDLRVELPNFEKIRAKYGRNAESEQSFLEELTRDQRVLLVITPDKPLEEWTSWGPPG